MTSTGCSTVVKAEMRWALRPTRKRQALRARARAAARSGRSTPTACSTTTRAGRSRAASASTPTPAWTTRAGAPPARAPRPSSHGAAMQTAWRSRPVSATKDRHCGWHVACVVRNAWAHACAAQHFSLRLFTKLRLWHVSTRRFSRAELQNGAPAATWRDATACGCASCSGGAAAAPCLRQGTARAAPANCAQPSSAGRAAWRR